MACIEIVKTEAASRDEFGGVVLYPQGTALYTASWIAPKADCHTQQYFHYMGQKGEIRADQAHRGYTMSTDEAGFAQLNPLYMKYTPGPSVRGRIGRG